MNNSLPSSYRDDFINTKKVTKNQLRIITGIEMFYGNFDDLKFIYASREVPELSDYIRKINELRQVKSRMTSVAASQGMKALSEEINRAKKIGSEVTKAKTKLLDKLHVLKNYNITEEDIESMYSQQD